MAKDNGKSVRKVLVFETDQTMLYLFEQILILHEFKPIAIHSCTELFEFSCKERPAAIIIDTNHLDRFKFNLLHKIKSDGRTLGVPVFATTPHWKDFGESFFLNQGFDWLIKQPIDITEFRRKLSEVLLNQGQEVLVASHNYKF